MDTSRKISIIIPSYNEAAHIQETLIPLQNLRKRGHQVILVDASSKDLTTSIAKPYVDHVVCSEKGRGVQLNAGIVLAINDIYWFVHADTKVDEQSVDQIISACATSYSWGRFDVQFREKNFLLSIIAFFMNRRSCWTGICTGDQGIFMTAKAYKRVGGFADIPLMEDIDISKKLKISLKPKCLSTKITTSARRWLNNGIVKTIFLMWWLRFAYMMGVSPQKLVSWYR